MLILPILHKYDEVKLRAVIYQMRTVSDDRRLWYVIGVYVVHLTTNGLFNGG